MRKGWQTKTLGEICTVDWGNTDLTKSSYVEGGKYLAVSAAGCDGRIGHKEHAKHTPVLSAIGAQCGRMFLPEEDFTAIKNTITLTPRDGTCTGKFLYQLLTHIELPKRGAAQPFISKGDIQIFQVFVPPLSEQQRIVGLLDEAFAGLTTAKANAERNLQNARALFASHLQSVFTQRGKGWVETNIGAEIKFIDYRGKTPVKTSSGVRLITAKNVKMGYLQETPMEFIAAASYKGWMTRGIPKEGDVLFTTEAPLANVAQLDTDEKVAFAQRIIVMQPNAARLDGTFLKYLLLSQPVQQRIRTKGTGATVQGIKASLLKLIDISFPKSLTEQEEIVAKLDSLRAETKRLASLYERKLAALEALKKSLLHQAFTGNL
jgi:type I restriction enzyme, S subunit